MLIIKDITAQYKVKKWAEDLTYGNTIKLRGTMNFQNNIQHHFQKI